MVAADPGLVLFATALATAVVGAAVAGVAYRGYRKHDSPTMLLLAVGIGLITVAPFVVSYGIAIVVPISEAAALLAILCANILGLLAMVYSLEV